MSADMWLLGSCCFLIGAMFGMALILWDLESGRVRLSNLEHWTKRAQWRESMPKEEAKP